MQQGGTRQRDRPAAAGYGSKAWPNVQGGSEIYVYTTLGQKALIQVEVQGRNDAARLSRVPKGNEGYWGLRPIYNEAAARSEPPNQASGPAGRTVGAERGLEGVALGCCRAVVSRKRRLVGDRRAGPVKEACGALAEESGGGLGGGRTPSPPANTENERGFTAISRSIRVFNRLKPSHRVLPSHAREDRGGYQAGESGDGARRHLRGAGRVRYSAPPPAQQGQRCPYREGGSACFVVRRSAQPAD